MTNGFGLPALLGTDPRVGTRCINKGKHRDVRFFSQTHQTQGFAVALGTWHTKIAFGTLFGVATLLMTNYHTRSEQHTSELQSRFDLVCRLLLEKKNNKYSLNIYYVSD